LGIIPVPPKDDLEDLNLTMKQNKEPEYRTCMGRWHSTYSKALQHASGQASIAWK